MVGLWLDVNIRATRTLEYGPSSADIVCSFNILATTLHTWRLFPPSATCVRVVTWDYYDDHTHIRAKIKPAQ
jgi:hypothetical protein